MWPLNSQPQLKRLKGALKYYCSGYACMLESEFMTSFLTHLIKHFLLPGNIKEEYN